MPQATLPPYPVADAKTIHPRSSAQCAPRWRTDGCHFVRWRIWGMLDMWGMLCTVSATPIWRQPFCCVLCVRVPYGRGHFVVYSVCNSHMGAPILLCTLYATIIWGGSHFVSGCVIFIRGSHQTKTADMKNVTMKVIFLAHRCWVMIWRKFLRSRLLCQGQRPRSPKILLVDTVMA